MLRGLQVTTRAAPHLGPAAGNCTQHLQTDFLPYILAGAALENLITAVHQSYPRLLGKTDTIIATRWLKTDPIDGELHIPP